MFIRVNLRHPCHPRSMEHVGRGMISGKYQRTNVLSLFSAPLFQAFNGTLHIIGTGDFKRGGSVKTDVL